MNVRQSAYVFGLIRSIRLEKVIEIGRQWGGSTLLIASTMEGRGQFRSIDDPQRLRYDIDVLGRNLDRPVENQVAGLCGQLGLNVTPISVDSRTCEIDTGEVDVVFIDGDHAYENARSDFERFGRRVRIGGALLLDDAIEDELFEPSQTADVKRLAREIERPASSKW